MAFNRAKILGLHRDWCAIRMLFALLCTMCVSKAWSAVLHAWVLVISGAANDTMAVLPRWEVVLGVPIGRVY